MQERHKERGSIMSGFELLDKGDGGMERYLLEPGDYQVNFGFPDFGEHEDDWLVKASDRESDWRKPFTFDFEDRAVDSFAGNLFRGESDFVGPEAVKALTERFGSLIPSMDINEPEYFTSLSEIVAVGRGTCAAKSVLLGSLIAKYTNLNAQAITGQYGPVQDKVSYPFHHQWMRITEGDNIYLFDPMYRRFVSFQERDGGFYSADNEYSYFQNLTPACYPAAKLISSLDIKRDGGVVRLVKSYNGSNSEAYVENEESLSTQLTNDIAYAFAVEEPKEFEVHDGAIKTGIGEASIYFPIRNFQRL